MGNLAPSTDRTLLEKELVVQGANGVCKSSFEQALHLNGREFEDYRAMKMETESNSWTDPTST